MEARVGEKLVQVSSGCPLNAPRVAALRRNLREHGLEAFLVSRKLGPFAGCVIEDLRKAGLQTMEEAPPV